MKKNTEPRIENGSIIKKTGRNSQRGYKSCMPHWTARSKPAGVTSKDSLLMLQPCLPKSTDIYLQLAYWGQGSCFAGSRGCTYGHTPDPPGYRWSQSPMLGRRSREVWQKDEFTVTDLSSGLASYRSNTNTLKPHRENSVLFSFIDAFIPWATV